MNAAILLDKLHTSVNTHTFYYKIPQHCMLDYLQTMNPMTEQLTKVFNYVAVR